MSNGDPSLLGKVLIQLLISLCPSKLVDIDYPCLLSLCATCSLDDLSDLAVTFVLDDPSAPFGPWYPSMS